MKRRTLARALCLLLAACGPAPGEVAVVSSDPELRALARELLPDLARRAGLELTRPVRLERRSREELVGYLTRKLDADLPPAVEERLTRSYALLGLVPENLDLRGLLLSVYTEQVAGFYDPDSTALFVLDDQPAEALRTVLIHELVHAVQDQAVSLDSLTARERGNDRQTAAQAAIEGHATLIMLEYLMEQVQGAPVDISDIDGFTELVRPALAGLAQYPALGQAPRVIQEALLFPYLEGAVFVQHLWREREGRPPPFWDHLPQSTAQVLDPGLLLGPGRLDPQEVELRVEQGGVVHTDVLGRLETGLVLEELAGAQLRAAAGWRGDRYALLDVPGGDALAWVVLWADEDSRNRFSGALEPVLERLPRPATLDRLEVDGHPALMLRVGEVGEVRAAAVPGPLGGASSSAAGAIPRRFVGRVAW